MSIITTTKNGHVKFHANHSMNRFATNHYVRKSVSKINSFGSGTPGNALLNEDGETILNEDGSFILTE